MKKTLITTTLFLTVSFFAKSQSIEEAKRDIYYERYESAKNDLQNIISKGNASPETWYWLSETYLKQKRIDSASQLLQNMPGHFLQQSSLKKQSPLVFIAWAHVLLDSGMTTAAGAEMEDVLKAGKYKNAEALLAAGRANLDSKNGDTSWAIELLNKAVKRDKKNREIYLALGDTYRKLVDGGNAVKNYDKALELDPSFAKAMYRKGMIYKTQNNPEVYIDRFTKAIAIDSNYTPALYELYYYYYFRDVVKADKFLSAYIRNADPSPQHAYMLTDLHYVSRKYADAINDAKNILKIEGDSAQPRLYKLIAYSYAALKDSAAALNYINSYFDNQSSDDFVAKDFELKASLLEKLDPDKNLAVTWYEKALAADTSKEERLNYMTTIADLQKELDKREREAVWREKIYNEKENPSKLDLYKWGIALYSADSLTRADSVFAIYEEKYPDEVHGYLWRATCNVLMDSTMEQGLAVPHYLKLAEVAATDSLKNKALLLRAYKYLAAYEANIARNYMASLEYYDKILALNPEDSNAEKNSEILAKLIEKGQNNLGQNNEEQNNN